MTTNITTKTNKIDIACNNFKQVHQSNKIKFKTLDDWLNKESNIFLKEVNSKNKTFKKYLRGQIVKVDFGINIGSELCYTHFAIVITKKDSIYSDIITVIPITSKNGNNRISLGNLLHKAYPNSLKYNLKCFGNLTQITTISKDRIFRSNKKYICNDNILDKIDSALIAMFTTQNKKYINNKD